MKNPVMAVVAATVWVSVSEFVRNTFLLHALWVEHYQKLGHAFPEAPVNGALWGVWSLCYAIAIYAIARDGSWLRAIALSWFIGFVLMWLVLGNLGVLPLGILPIAVPLSVLEAAGAVWLVRKLGAAK